MDEETIEYIKKGGNPSRTPFNVGIKAFKRLLKESSLSKSDKNKAVKMYKQRIAARMIEVKRQFDEAIEKERLSESKDSVNTLSEKGLDNGPQV